MTVPQGPKTVEERLQKTHEAATSERNKYKRKGSLDFSQKR